MDARTPADDTEDEEGYDVDYHDDDDEEGAVISDSSEETTSTTSTTTRRPFAVRPYQEAVTTTQKSVTSVMGTWFYNNVIYQRTLCSTQLRFCCRYPGFS